MTFSACSGVQSRVNPSQALRLCQSCALYVYAADGIEPKARRSGGGDNWSCVNRVSSLPAERPDFASAGTDTGAGSFQGEG